MRLIKDNSLYLLTIYAVIVVVWAALSWETLALAQKLAAGATAIFALHEWEEQRFPGGFYEKMMGAFGVGGTADSPAGKAGESAMHGPSGGSGGSAEQADPSDALVYPDCLGFALTILALAFPQWPFFTYAILLCGVLEGIVHAAGVRLWHMPKPYTPGMATAEVFALFALVGMYLLVAGGTTTALDWLGGFVWLAACFAVMESLVWRSVGISPKDMPARMKAAIGNARRE